MCHTHIPPSCFPHEIIKQNCKQNALAVEFFFTHSGLCCSEFTDGLDVYLHRVTKNLKEYAVKALVNTVDHLGSISFKVSSLIDQRFNEVADANLRISGIQQVSKGFSSWNLY